jgi:hypothetical protein
MGVRVTATGSSSSSTMTLRAFFAGGRVGGELATDADLDVVAFDFDLESPSKSDSENKNDKRFGTSCHQYIVLGYHQNQQQGASLELWGQFWM